MALTEADHKDILLALLAEHSAAMREKSQPEYVYTAAVVAGFGAVCWGVAALQTTSYSNRFWTHPALIATIGILFTSIAVITKFHREHAAYRRIRGDRATADESLKTLLGDKGPIIPDEFLKRPSGGGVYYSSAVVSVAALGSMAFCLAILVH